jgi:hypothetical protein
VRVCDEIIEIAIRLFLKIICVLLGYGTANTLHGNAADLKLQGQSTHFPFPLVIK